jgi:transporter family-2 protein
MTAMILAAFLAGVLVTLSRALNGRLSLSGSPLRASLWNHAVGFVFLAAAALITGAGLPAALTGGAPPPPALAWAGGPIGVIFVAAGSWLVTRIGAAATALLVIAGQMLSGVALDAATGAGGITPVRVAGVGLILAGVWLAGAGRSGRKAG